MSLSAGLRFARARSSLPSHGFPSPIYRPILLAGATSPKHLISRTPPSQASVFTRAASSSAAAAAAAATTTTNPPTTTTTRTQTKVPMKRPSPSTLSPSHPKPNPPTPAPTTTTSNQVFSPLLNPPSTTRPPPLSLPVRDPATAYVTYLFRLGKAYTAFYTAGLKAVFTNRRLLSASPAHPLTRSHLLLRHRVRHDLSRLPIFGLVMLVCGELTPFVVLLFPQLTPYTCRIPRQIAVIRRAARRRRDASFRALAPVLDNQGVEAALAHADGHVCRSLGLTGALWDRLGVDGPLAGSRAAAAVRGLVLDDALIRDGGGAAALEGPEVVLACEDRGIDVAEMQEQEGEAGIGGLRAKLEQWLARTAPGVAEKEGGGEGPEGKVRRLLLGLDGRI